MQILIPDSIADEIHWREISDSEIKNITDWKELIRRVHVLDSVLMGIDPLKFEDCTFTRVAILGFSEILAIYGDFDGCGHHIGVVLDNSNETTKMHDALLVAEFLLSQWRCD